MKNKIKFLFYLLFIAVMLSSGETIKLQIKMKLKPSQPMPSKMEIQFKNNNIFGKLWLIRNYELDMNVPLYVIRNDNEGNPILINKAENHNRVRLSILCTSSSLL